MTQFQVPSPDDIFQKWLMTRDRKELKKIFGVDDREAISSAEYVKEVDRTVLFYFKVVSSSHQSNVREIVKKEEVIVKKIRKIKFHEITKPIDEETVKWKDGDKVPDIRSLKEIPCNKCKKTGFFKCKTCNGAVKITCHQCKGSGRVSCPTCKGKKVITISIQVIKDGSKKSSRQLEVQCNDCFGLGSVACKECRGIGIYPCPNCKGQLDPCPNCDGHGVLYSYEVMKVPFVVKSEKRDFMHVSKKYGWLLKDKDLLRALDQAEAFHVNEIKQLTEETIKNYLGIPKLEKDVEKPFKECKKTFESMKKAFENKKSPLKPTYPITLYFVQVLRVESKKGKKFDLLGIGTKERFVVLKH